MPEMWKEGQTDMNARELDIYHKFEKKIDAWGDGARKGRQISRKKGMDICVEYMKKSQLPYDLKEALMDNRLLFNANVITYNMFLEVHSQMSKRGQK